MKDNELGKNDPKNNPLEPRRDTILAKNDQMGQDTSNSQSKQIAPINPINPSQIDLLCQKLDNLPPNTKVKVKILDFESFREFLPLVNKYTSKFEVFKYETEFNVVSDLTPDSTKKEITNFKESFINYLNINKIDESIKKILEEEIK